VAMDDRELILFALRNGDDDLTSQAENLVVGLFADILEAIKVLRAIAKAPENARALALAALVEIESFQRLDGA
jgi:hypothetical protein